MTFLILLTKILSGLVLAYLLLPSVVALCQLKLWKSCPKALLYYALIIVPVELLGKFVNYILALPLAIFSVTKGISVLPPPLNWFHTHDDDMDGGQHQLGWPVVTGIALIWQRTRWMCRNAFYGGSFALFSAPKSCVVLSDETGTWDSGSSNYSLILSPPYTSLGKFGLRAQWFYTKTRFVRVWIGHSFQGSPVNGKYITKCHVGLFRSWSN